MALLNKREVKILLTFFFIYSLFVYWVGDNENSRFFLTRTIFDEGRLEIDSYYNQTTDRSFANGHYYSDKEPGTSFLGIPIYAVWKFVYNYFPDTLKEKTLPKNEFVVRYVNKTSIITLNNPGFFSLTSMMLITIFTSSLFSALIVVLIYKISRSFTNNEKHRLLLTLTAGLGTLIFPYALVFLEHGVATFFSFLSFYLLFKTKQEKIKDKKYYLLAGLSSGYAITISLMTILIGLCNLAYLLTFDKKKTWYFILGSFIGLLPFLTYNSLVFHTPFTLPRHYLDPSIWPKLGGIYGLQTPNPFVMLRLMFFPHKGLFLYYPILFLSLFGLWFMYKKFKTESILIIFIFFALLVMNSSWWAWWGGACFGPRHLTPTIPFLVLPLIFLVEKHRIKYLVYFFLIFSILVNFAGLQPIEDELEDVNNVDMVPKFKGMVNTFQIMVNPLYDYYIPSSLSTGPRSRIFESLTNLDFPIDIRFISLEIRDYIQYFYFYVPFLCLLPIFIVFLIIWHKEIFNKIKTIFSLKNRWKFIILLIFLSIILFFILYPLPTTLIFYKGWYPLESTEELRWMKDNGKLLVYNQGPNKTIQLSMLVASYYENRDVEVYLNDEKIDELIAFPNTQMEYNKVFNLKSGLNSINFKSKSKCSIPNMIEGINDWRCLSISMNFTEESPMYLIFQKYWYPTKSQDELKWMWLNGSMEYFNYDNQPKKARLHIYSRSLYKDRTASLYLNDNLIDEFTVFKENTGFDSSIMSFLPGENLLELRTKENCTIIAKIEKNNDFRCVSIGLLNVSIIPIAELEQPTEMKFTFTKNWYDKDIKEKDRWMKYNGEITIYNSQNTTQTILTNITGRSFFLDRNIELLLNNEKISEFIGFKEGSTISILLNLEPGYNTLTLESQDECKQVNIIDTRCLSFGITNISFQHIMRNKKNLSLIFSTNWYDKEEIEEDRFMKDNGTITVFNFANNFMDINLSFGIDSFAVDREVNLFLNNELIDTFTVKKNFMLEYSNLIQLSPGKNILTVNSLQECSVVAEIEKNDDFRCISIGIKDVLI